MAEMLDGMMAVVTVEMWADVLENKMAGKLVAYSAYYSVVTMVVVTVGQ